MKSNAQQLWEDWRESYLKARQAREPLNTQQMRDWSELTEAERCAWTQLAEDNRYGV